MVPSKPVSKTRIRETNKLQILKTFKFVSDYRNSASYECNSRKKKRFLSNTFSVTGVRTTKSKLISFCHVSKVTIYDLTNLITLVVVAFTKYNNSCTLPWLNKINKKGNPRRKQQPFIFVQFLFRLSHVAFALKPSLS